MSGGFEAENGRGGTAESGRGGFETESGRGGTHDMRRRSFAHDYTRTGFYHITMHVAEGMGKPLGSIAGTEAGGAVAVLTAVGAAIERELLTAITAHYPMVLVDTYVIMPEHLHFILNVIDPIVSRNGRRTHLGQVIAGFKQGCNRAFWAVTGRGEAGAAAERGEAGGNAGGGNAGGGDAGGGKTAAHSERGVAADTVGGGFAASNGADGAGKGGAGEADGGKAGAGKGGGAGKERFDSGRAVLFEAGYCDVMPVEAGQLETQRAYIRNNPLSRWLRSRDRERLQPRRGGIDSALTVTALLGYVRRVCHPALVGGAVLTELEGRLLRDGRFVGCDSYGDRALLRRRLLPVVCHRRDAARRAEQRRRCLEEAARGAVLVSARIARGEQEIIDAALRQGGAVVIVVDNGLPTVYHPSAERIQLCAMGRLLLVTPWRYEFRGKQEGISVPLCQAMNCIAQALCRLGDDWWKQ